MQKSVVVALTWVLFAVDAVLVICRICVRKLQLRKPLAWSDRLILLALAINCTKCVVDTWLQFGGGMGPGAAPTPNMWGRDFENMQLHFTVAYAASYLYIFNVWVVKASFLAFYYVFHKRLSTALRWTLHATAAVVGITLLLNVFMNSFYCSQTTNDLLSRMPSCRAFISTDTFVVLTGTNILTDAMLMIVPALLLHAAHLRCRRRHFLAFAFVLLVGSFSIVSAAVRFALLFRKTDRFAPSELVLQGGAFPLWSQVDSAAGLAAACLPAFRVYLRERSIASSSGAEEARSRGDGVFGGAKSRGDGEFAEVSAAGSGGSRGSRGGIGPEMVSWPLERGVNRGVMVLETGRAPGAPEAGLDWK